MITVKQFGRTERAFDWADLAVIGLLVALIYAMVTVAREWSGPLQAIAEIHLEVRYLPLYALFSLARGVIAYGVSFLFTMVYGYAMARVHSRSREPGRPGGPGGPGGIEDIVDSRMAWLALANKSSSAFSSPAAPSFTL